jgi:hypothetical protein
LTELRKLMSMPLLGFDTDNDAVFMNETVRDYCLAEGIAFTRCRPYRKNDQAKERMQISHHAVGIAL